MVGVDVFFRYCYIEFGFVLFVYRFLNRLFFYFLMLDLGMQMDLFMGIWENDY